MGTLLPTTDVACTPVLYCVVLALGLNLGLEEYMYLCDCSLPDFVFSILLPFLRESPAARLPHPCLPFLLFFVLYCSSHPHCLRIGCHLITRRPKSIAIAPHSTCRYVVHRHVLDMLSVHTAQRVSAEHVLAV